MCESSGSASTAIGLRPIEPGFGASPGSKKAASAGDSVSALNAEIAIENAIVSENCLYRMPVVPGKEAYRHKHRDQHQRGRDHRAGHFGHRDGLRGVRIGPGPQLRWRCTFSMTTIASSTTSPVASVMPNSVSELMENPKSLMNAKVPISETGIVIAGMIVARQSCRNRKITMMTMTIASASVFSTSLIESDTTVVVSTAMTPLRPGGNYFCNSTSTALHRLVHIERIGVRELLHAEADRIVAAVEQAGVVGLGAQFRTAHILQQHDPGACAFD